MKNTTDNSSIIFDKVTKSYIISKGRYGLLGDFLAENSLRLFRGRNYLKNRMRAINNISFKIEKGEAVGFIGRNGAGKTTILKLMSKITSPDAGIVETRGKIGAFIELGAGL